MNFALIRKAPHLKGLELHADDFESRFDNLSGRSRGRVLGGESGFGNESRHDRAGQRDDGGEQESANFIARLQA